MGPGKIKKCLLLPRKVNGKKYKKENNVEDK